MQGARERGREVQRMAPLRGIMLVAAAAGVVACGRSSTTAVEGETADLRAPASIRIEALGGIAGLRQVVTVDSATAAASYVLGPLCGTPGQCPASDSVEGVVPRTDVDTWFGLAAASRFRALRADYGRTVGGADMRDYIVTIFANDRVRTLRGDDGSLPPLLSEFVSRVMMGVQTAVGR